MVTNKVMSPAAEECIRHNCSVRLVYGHSTDHYEGKVRAFEKTLNGTSVVCTTVVTVTEALHMVQYCTVRRKDCTVSCRDRQFCRESIPNTLAREESSIAPAIIHTPSKNSGRKKKKRFEKNRTCLALSIAGK